MFAVLLTVAVPGVEHIVDLFRVQGDETETVGDEFVGENGRVGFYFDEIDGHGGDFGEHDAAQGV